MLSRRDVMVALFGAPFAARLLAGCDEPEVAPAVTGSLRGPSVEQGHRLRTFGTPGGLTLDDFRAAPVERVEVAVLGGGPAGLSAMWRLLRRGVQSVRLFELEDSVGGTSLHGQDEVTRYPWGAHYLPLPAGDNPDLIALLEEMNALEGRDERGRPIGAEHLLVREPAERVHFQGFWYRGLYPYAGASPEDLAQLARFRGLIDHYVGLRDGRGRRAFSIPLSRASDDSDLMALDEISAAAWMDRQGFTSPRLRWLVGYACRDDYGLTLEQASAWGAIFYWAARTAEPGEDTSELLTWPEGNGALVEHLAGAADGHIVPGHLVVDVEPTDEGVRISLFDIAADRPKVVLAERCVVATPRFIAKHIVRPLRERNIDEGFAYGAWLVANLHLKDRPVEQGFPAAWDNVLYDSPSLGYVSATHQRGRDFGPTVWTYYLPMTDADPRVGRQRMYDADWAGGRDAIVRDLVRAHPDLPAHLQKMDIWRWGHAMIQPRVGFIKSAARRSASAPIGAVHFAHSDLSGVALFEEAFDHGVRAADEILAARAAAVAPLEVDTGGAATETEG